MRSFIYYSRTAPTTGSYIKENLQDSGRIDIAIHSVISSFFLSNKLRPDVRLHLLFAGPPTPPRHLQLQSVTSGKTGVDKIYFSKTNIAIVLKKMLYKYKEGKNNEVYPGFFIQKKGLIELINDLEKQGENLYILDPKGQDVREVDIKPNPIFVIGDHLGLPAKELKRLKKICTPVTIGKRTYFASQTIAIVNNELDRREDAGRL